jgi:hypothetical protein
VTGRAWFVRVGAIAGVAIAAWWIVHAWRTGAYTTVAAEAMILGSALYLGFSDQIARFAPPAQRWRVGVQDGGIGFRQNRFRVLASLGAVLALLLGIFFIGVLQMLGSLDVPTRIPTTSQDRVLLSLLPILGGVCGVLALVLVGSWLWSIGATGAKAGSLVINRDGVTAWSKGRPAMPWDAIRDVQLAGGNSNRAATLMVDGSPKPLKLALDPFPQDSAALADMVRFYWRNADCRHELGTERAVARWERRDFHRLPQQDVS